MKLVRAAVVFVILGCLSPRLLHAAKAVGEPGLEVLFKSDSGSSTTVVRPNVWLYVPAGESPSSSLPPGRFLAEWNGFLLAELRADFQFQAELSGRAVLEINGKRVFEVDSASSPVPAPGPAVRLNKGTNAFRVQFTSPASGDAHLRLNWFNKETPPGPVPASSLVHIPSESLRTAQSVASGKALFLNHRCASCHRTEFKPAEGTELAMDAPSLNEIGSRRGEAWMARWILDPHALRPTAEMPRILHGPQATEDAAAAAAFLASLKGAGPVSKETAASSEQIEFGQKIFESQHCAACHLPPGEKSQDSTRIGLQHVNQKFAAGSLPGFLQKPEAHFQWTRMPNFRFSDTEATQLAAFLTSKADPASGTASASPPDAARIARGREIILSRGCLQCHPSSLTGNYQAKALAQLGSGGPEAGCLSKTPADKNPDFRFTDSQRADLKAFLATGTASLKLQAPAEIADRFVERLQCRECHGKFEGLPQFDGLGVKIRPEYLDSIISGKPVTKPRPWLESRMPGFASRARMLAEGLAHMHGLPARSSPEPTPDPTMVQAGQKLVSAAGGFSCISCHGVASVAPTQVFESPGINLALSADRLQKSYFHRWLRNPLAVDSTTKMPVYFDEEGRSPLAEILGGDGDKQREAVWQYLLLREKMPPPPMP